jgi:hypothetical protein
MSAYIYKLTGPKKFTWMNVQEDAVADTSVTCKVYHMKFWYKPYASMEDDDKLQRKLMAQEDKTKEQFKDINVRYAIMTYDGRIAAPFNHGEFFGCNQVVAWKLHKNHEGKIIHPGVRNRVLFNDESIYNVWCKAVVSSKADVAHHVRDDLCVS